MLVSGIVGVILCSVVAIALVAVYSSLLLSSRLSRLEEEVYFQGLLSEELKDTFSSSESDSELEVVQGQKTSTKGKVF